MFSTAFAALLTELPLGQVEDPAQFADRYRQRRSLEIGLGLGLGLGNCRHGASSNVSNNVV